MAQDRADDSYAIYSQLLKNGPIEWRDAPRKQWLLESTTNAIPLDAPCHPDQAVAGLMNPYTAVQAPADRQDDWNEVLADYEQHCHDVVALDRERFSTDLPVRLLSADDKAMYERDPLNPPTEFADGAGLHRFTEVFFNRNHTLALVEQGMWCGGLCGNWQWVVLERQHGRWTSLPWVRMTAMS